MSYACAINIVYVTRKFECDARLAGLEYSSTPHPSAFLAYSTGKTNKHSARLE